MTKKHSRILLSKLLASVEYEGELNTQREIHTHKNANETLNKTRASKNDR